MQQQILEHDVAIDPPAPRTAAPDVHLPVTMTALLGRDADLAQVGELLSDHRLVTRRVRLGDSSVPVPTATAVAFMSTMFVVWMAPRVIVHDGFLYVDSS